MKSRVLFLLALLAGSVNVLAQNLVPNGSFEEGSECPMFLDDLHFRCNHWYKSIQEPGVPMNENPSPDWYHACSELDELSTPNFVIGYQEPSDGGGIAAIYCFDSLNPDYREIMGVELSEPMEVGQIYSVKFKLVTEGLAITTGIGMNKIGFKLTTFPVFSSFSHAVDNDAHGYTEDLVLDTLNWTEFAFEIEADSSYSYIHFGSFFENSEIDTLVFGLNFTRGAYYFFDEISVIQESLSYQSEQSEQLVKIFPNPASTWINITLAENNLKSFKLLEIIDLNGVVHEVFKPPFHSIYPIDKLAKGLYLVNIVFDDGTSTQNKMIKL